MYIPIYIATKIKSVFVFTSAQPRGNPEAFTLVTFHFSFLEKLCVSILQLPAKHTGAGLRVYTKYLQFLSFFWPVISGRLYSILNPWEIVAYVAR